MGLGHRRDLSRVSCYGVNPPKQPFGHYIIYWYAVFNITTLGDVPVPSPQALNRQSFSNNHSG